MAGINPAQTLFLFLLVVVFVGAVIYNILQAPRNRFRVKTLQQLKALSPSEFEQAVATLLEDLGYQKVQVVGGAGDLARDISATDENGIPVVVQCKRYRKPVGSKDVQLFIGMLQTEYRGSRGIYVTTATFTRPALELGRRHNIEIWSGDYLADSLLKLQEVRAQGDKAQTNENSLEAPREKAIQQITGFCRIIEQTIKEMTPPNEKPITILVNRRTVGQIAIECSSVTISNLPILQAAIDRHSISMPPNVKQVFGTLVETYDKRAKETKA